MKGSKKFSFQSIKPIAIGVMGGFLGNQVSNQIQKSGMLATNPNYIPLVSATIGVVGATMMPKAHDFFLGMAIVSGTEFTERMTGYGLSLVTQKASTQTQGRKMNAASNFRMGGYNGYGTMGFVPQIVPQGAATFKVNNLPVR